MLEERETEREIEREREVELLEKRARVTHWHNLIDAERCSNDHRRRIAPPYVSTDATS